MLESVQQRSGRKRWRCDAAGGCSPLPGSDLRRKAEAARVLGPTVKKLMPRPETSKKVRLGQFYTSDAVTEFMVELSNKPQAAQVLETSYGEGAFLRALLAAGYHNIVGYEVDPANYAQVRAQYGTQVDVRLQNYLQTPHEERYDLIIGNPPYVQWNNIDLETRRLLREAPFWKQYSNGEWDLLYAFIIWSVEKLAPGGELIFIVPYNWFNATYAASLRRYLAQRGSFETLVHFSEYKLFADCAPNAIIFKYRTGNQARGRHPYIKVAEFEGRQGTASELIATARTNLALLPEGPAEIRDDDWRFFTSRHLPADELWYLATPSQEDTVRRLEAVTRGRVLSESLNVAVGVVSGYDHAFALTEEQVQALPANERALVERLVKARGCTRYGTAVSAPYIFTESVHSEEELRTDYPTVYAHLLAHREQLQARYQQNKHWWRWATIRNLPLFRGHARQPKLFVPGIDRSLVARFSLSAEPVLGSGDVICVAAQEDLAESMLYVLGWLNSSVVNTWYGIKGSRTGHRTRYTQAYVSHIPYRPIDFSDKEEVRLHDLIVDASTRANAAGPNTSQRTQAEQDVDSAVVALLSS